MGFSERPLRVAIVGAGPSGYYAAAALLDKAPRDVSIDVFDRLPAPFGLVRYGVAPDHQKIKSVSRVFHKTASDPRVRFLGNVGFGTDIALQDLLAHYDQVVFAVGGQSDRRLEIPGEDLAGSHSSTAFVAWYSGHPDFIDLDVDLSCERVAVVGIGNVAIDVARILVRSVEELATTDIADPALDALRQSRVREVYIIARRGPVQAKCTAPELNELAELDGVDLAVEARDLELDAASAAALEEDRPAQKNLKILRQLAEQGASGAQRKLTFRFLESPLEIVGEGGRVAGLKVERNRLEERSGGYLAAVGTGETETLPVGMVIRAVGYRSLPLPGVPFDERKGLIPNREGRVLDPESGDVVPRLYAVGWVKRGATGLIGSNKPDAVETVERMLEDLEDPLPVGDAEASCEAVDGLLRQRGVRVVTYADWERLDANEVRRGSAQGRPRVKLVHLDEMLAELTG